MVSHPPKRAAGCWSQLNVAVAGRLRHRGPRRRTGCYLTAIAAMITRVPPYGARSPYEYLSPPGDLSQGVTGGPGGLGQWGGPVPPPSSFGTNPPLVSAKLKWTYTRSPLGPIGFRTAPDRKVICTRSTRGTSG